MKSDTHPQLPEYEKDMLHFKRTLRLACISGASLIGRGHLFRGVGWHWGAAPYP